MNKFGGKSKKKLNYTEFMEFVFSKSDVNILNGFQIPLCRIVYVLKTLDGVALF